MNVPICVVQIYDEQRRYKFSTRVTFSFTNCTPAMIEMKYFFQVRNHMLLFHCVGVCLYYQQYMPLKFHVSIQNNFLLYIFINYINLERYLPMSPYDISI